MTTQQQYILICPNCGSVNTNICYSNPLTTMGCYDCNCDYHNSTGEILLSPSEFREEQRNQLSRNLYN